MRTLALLLALSLVPVCASAQEPEYRGKSLNYWITRTQAEHDVLQRREAIRTLRQIGIMRTRRAASSDRSAAIAWVAASITPTLDGLLKDRDAAVRAEAALAICGIDRKASKDAIPALTELLGDRNEGVRKNAAVALCFRGPATESAIPALVKVLKKDASPDVRHEAALALRTGGPKGVESLLGMLDDASADVRRSAVGVLEGRYPDVEPHETPLKAVPKLLALLQDSSLEVRKGAAIALVRISDVPREAIVQLLRHNDIRVRHAAANALLFSMRKETKRFQTELLAFMNGDTTFCRQNVGLLSRAGPKSVPILVRLLDDRDPSVRGRAASDLGELGRAAKEAADALKRLLTDLAEIPHSDLDDRVCHHAAAALNQILGDKDYREGLPNKRPDGL